MGCDAQLAFGEIAQEELSGQIVRSIKGQTGQIQHIFDPLKKLGEE